MFWPPETDLNDVPELQGLRLGEVGGRPAEPAGMQGFLLLLPNRGPPNRRTRSS